MAQAALTATSLAGLTISKVKERSQWLNLMIYGDSGIGKTTLSGSASVVKGMSPVIVVDIEGGTESLRRPYPDVEVITVRTWKQMQDVYNELYEGKHGYKTVVIDSFTEVQKFSMNEIMRELIERRPELDPDVPSKREWGKNLNQMRNYVRGFRDLEMHTIFTALNKSTFNENSGLTTNEPNATGQFAKEIPALLDVVLYYYMKAVTTDNGVITKRLLLSQKTETIVAKDRTGTLPMVLEDPTMEMMFKLMSSKPAKMATNLLT